VASVAVSTHELGDQASDEHRGSGPAVSRILLLTAPDFGTCQMCLTEPGDAVIDGQPWCRGCRDTFAVERTRGAFTE
jgi:hypothetical protein